jgi:chitodextrinase
MLIRRRPSAATFVAIVFTLLVATQTGLASSAQGGRGAPDLVSSVEVTATDSSSVTVAWPPSRDNSVAGYTVYLNSVRVGTEAPNLVRRWRDRDILTYKLERLTCGTGYTVGIDTFDRDDRHSKPITTTVSTAACPDTAAPSAPTGIRQTASTESSVVLAWTPSTDNVGVVEYGIYASGIRVTTASDANATLTGLTCGKSYLIALDAADAAGNRSAQTSAYYKTSACPSTNKPPTTPTVVKVTAATANTVALSWTASTDDVAVTGYGLYLSGSRISETTSTTGQFTGLKCGTTYPLGVDAKDAAGLRSATANLSAATSPCTPTTPPEGSITQTIGNGSTVKGVVSWYAVYDANGDKVEDDPGKVEWRVDGTLVRTEVDVPFGDDASFWPSTSVADGTHTFEVRAVNGSGTVLAKNTITATVANTPAPTGDQIAPSQPSNLKVTSASATNVGVAWSPATDNVAVTGYDVYRGSTLATTTPQTTANLTGLSCGNAYQVGVDANDAAGNSSPPATMAVTTSACPDSQPPSAPTNVTASTRTTTSIALTWAPATDNVGVAGYGVYNAGALVNTTAGTTGIVGGLTCGTNYTLAVDAFDATGNSSPKTTVMVATLPCTDTSAPTVSVTAPASGVTIGGTINASASAADNVGVTRVEFLRDGSVFGQDTTSPYSISLDSTTVTNGSHTFGARAYDAAGNVGNATNITATVSNPAQSAPGCSLNATPSNFAAQVSAAAAGQTVCLATGNYSTWSGTNKNITVQPSAGATPQMRISFGSGDSGFTLDGMTGMGGNISGASNITVRNSTFTGSLDADGANVNVVLDGNKFNWNTSGTTGQNSKLGLGGGSGGTSVIVRNNEFKNGDLDGIFIGGGSGYLILNNTFDNLCDTGTNHTDQIQFADTSPAITQTRIAGNYIHAPLGCGTQGITSFDHGTNGVIIENNVVDIHRPWGIELYSDVNSIVRHNTVVWYPDSQCDFNGMSCGGIDLNRKSADPAGTGTQVYDNLATVGFGNGSSGNAHHNISSQTAVYVGPTSIHDGFILASSSPVGRNAASDGTNAGVYANGS